MVLNLDDLRFWTKLALPQRKDLISRLKIAHDIKMDNFESVLIRLLHKADCVNGDKLRQVYPHLTAVVYAWQSGLINPDYTEMDLSKET